MMPAIAPQPEYRALMMFDELPPGCIAFPCTNESSLPHIRPGEFVVVDTADRTPRHGELYVIAFGEHPRQRHICMARKRMARWQLDGPEEPMWHVGAIVNDEWQRARSQLMAADLPDDRLNMALIGEHVRLGAWTEGPYAGHGTSWDHLRSCLVGCIIGLYGPKSCA